MDQYSKSESEKNVLGYGVAEGIAVAGFLMLTMSTFINFLPITKANWISVGVGLPVMFASLAGAFLILFKKHFESFFAAMFSAFFLTLEIIIIYDKKALELGAEKGADGWFRSVPMIFGDALNLKVGAFWAFTGVVIAILAIIGGWIFHASTKNRDCQLLNAEATPENDSEESDEYSEESSFDSDNNDEEYENDEDSESQNH
jgi:hypothetical protein